MIDEKVKSIEDYFKKYTENKVRTLKMQKVIHIYIYIYKHAK